MWFAVIPTPRSPPARLQVEELDDIPRHHPGRFIGGHAREVRLDDPVRVRVLGLLVREVRGPDELIDAQQVAQAHAHAVLLKTPEDVRLEVVRRLLRQRLPPQDLPGPVPVPLVANIGHLIGPGEPADLGLREEQW